MTQLEINLCNDSLSWILSTYIIMHIHMTTFYFCRLSFKQYIFPVKFASCLSHA